MPGQQAHGTAWMLDATRRRLTTQPAPWVIENVPGAPLRVDYKLCGCMFQLPLLGRERWFETSWRGFDLRSPCYHPDGVLSVVGHDLPSYQRAKGYTRAIRPEIMGIDWMGNGPELGLAIPPAYTEYIGGLLIQEILKQPA